VNEADDLSCNNSSSVLLGTSSYKAKNRSLSSYDNSRAAISRMSQSVANTQGTAADGTSALCVDYSRVRKVQHRAQVNARHVATLDAIVAERAV